MIKLVITQKNPMRILQMFKHCVCYRLLTLPTLFQLDLAIRNAWDLARTTFSLLVDAKAAVTVGLPSL